jgi:hypothetical protein
MMVWLLVIDDGSHFTASGRQGNHSLLHGVLEWQATIQDVSLHTIVHGDQKVPDRSGNGGIASAGLAMGMHH